MAQKQTFDAWKKAVDATIYQKTGMTGDDIDDWRYQDDYNDGMSATRSAARAISNAKKNSGM